MLTLENISVYYGAVQALKGISLTVNEGEIITLIGANGAGKSTTLRTISGLNQASQGKISFLNQDITSLAPNKIVALGLSQVPEGRHIFPQLTVAENISLGSFLRTDKQEIKRDLDYIYETFPRLKERLFQQGETLSGGEQQMLAIARALMARPKMLLLDEPSLGLAPIIVKTIFDVIEEINKQGCTIFLVEQNAQIALKIAHRAYVLENGIITMEDQADKLLGNKDIQKAYLGG